MTLGLLTEKEAQKLNVAAKTRGYLKYSSGHVLTDISDYCHSDNSTMLQCILGQYKACVWNEKYVFYSSEWTEIKLWGVNTQTKEIKFAYSAGGHTPEI